MTETDDVIAAPQFPVPEDLYIPPDGLDVITQVFEGPLDLLLHLIRKNKLDVLDLPVAEIAEQYASFIELMESIQMDIAGEYLVMAATLAKIKSRMLLPPKHDDDDEEDIDPRLELALRLQEYERIKKLAQWLEVQPRVGRDMFPIQCERAMPSGESTIPPVELTDVVAAFKNVLVLADREQSMILGRETLSVKERVTAIMNALRNAGGHMRFQDLYDMNEGRPGMVVSLLAVLELINSNSAYAVQAGADSHIHVHLNDRKT